MNDAVMTLNQLDVPKIRELISSGSSSCLELTDLFCQQAKGIDEKMTALAFFHPKAILRQAALVDDGHARGLNHAARLEGVPVAISDNMDSLDMFSTIGSPLLEGRHPRWDASLVKRLRDDGAITFCKAKVPEFNLGQVPEVSNPIDLERQVGLAAGAAAALVASGVVPVSVGTQSLGSIAESASYCGVVGFKPSRHLISQSGIFRASPTLEQVGIFSRTVEDAALLAEIMLGSDDQDPDTKGILPRPLLAVCKEEVPFKPHFVFLKTPDWVDMNPEAKEAIEALLEELVDQITVIDLPESTIQSKEWHEIIVRAEFSQSLETQERQISKKAPKRIADMIKASSKITAQEYLRALNAIEMVSSSFDEFFDRFDCILTPSSLGFAPLKSEAASPSSLANSLWAVTGMPTISLPILQSSQGLPLGVQLTGKQFDDARLLRTARWFLNHFNQ
jgi:Asp-tRNA(Asn)/Glu-tRNA(Gln) amidotransferase A subunit family amidase